MPCNHFLFTYSHNISTQFNRSENCERINSVSSVTQCLASQFTQLSCVLLLSYYLSCTFGLKWRSPIRGSYLLCVITRPANLKYYSYCNLLYHTLMDISFWFSYFQQNTYLFVTDFEVQNVTYEILFFFPFDLWPPRFAPGH